MTNHEKLLRKPLLFRMFTGLSAVEFDKLVADLEPVWLARKAQRAARRPRQRKPGAGRQVKLLFADRLLMTLLYYRAYVTQEFVGFLFGVDKGTVSREAQELGLCMAGVFRIPERKVRIDRDEIEAVFVDATEQPVHRPERKQRRSYSGKKKRHTIEHRVVVARKGKGPGEKQKVRIKAVSKAARGRVHDKKVYDRSRLQIPAGVPKSGDSGYQGSDLRVPKKKPRKGSLSDEEIGRAHV